MSNCLIKRPIGLIEGPTNCTKVSFEDESSIQQQSDVLVLRFNKFNSIQCSDWRKLNKCNGLFKIYIQQSGGIKFYTKLGSIAIFLITNSTISINMENFYIGKGVAIGSESEEIEINIKEGNLCLSFDEKHFFFFLNLTEKNDKPHFTVKYPNNSLEIDFSTKKDWKKILSTPEKTNEKCYVFDKENQNNQVVLSNSIFQIKSLSQMLKTCKYRKQSDFINLKSTIKEQEKSKIIEKPSNELVKDLGDTILSKDGIRQLYDLKSVKSILSSNSSVIIVNKVPLSLLANYNSSKPNSRRRFNHKNERNDQTSSNGKHNNSNLVHKPEQMSQIDLGTLKKNAIREMHKSNQYLKYINNHLRNTTSSRMDSGSYLIAKAFLF